MEIRSCVHKVALLLLLSGCDGETEASGDARGSGGSGGTAGAATGGMAAGGTASGGQATAGSSAAGTSAVGGGSCSATFGTAVPLLVEDPGYQMGGVSLTGDELELYYARNLVGGPVVRYVVRRKRGSRTEPFGPVEPLPELVDVCGANPYVNPDVTDDGLTLYVTCTQDVELGLSEGVSPLRVAHRPDRNSAFTLQTEPVGGVFASAGISADELTAYTDGEIFDTAPRMFTRASKTESFGEAQPVPGIDVALRSPDISNDGLALFGAAAAASGSGSTIYRALRSDAGTSFGAPTQLDLQVPAPGLGAPNITPSCTLYLIAAGANATYMIYSAAMQ